ncbi:NADH-dependent flavin oxidoreductase [Pasteurella bettyae]|uniref:Oxidoreductase, FAD/FMN dependent n=1 Tax=Pasteurella bettyae CCUG 2042 TaxID=1095749 RepID=I3DBM5_9PAST|nr:NADH-dependent flavin oxidoreductase [Pasteurella bettyae]EIJ69118.1 oxidoreductase, FAD/FMN dependent [Pasteurella bettyae CCUG 2042]SUB22817.1 NADH oxidase [Pasteurella bettyae]
MNSKYAPLFEAYRLNNGVEIKNRLAVAPMTHFASHENGTLSEEERIFIGNRANDVGMFILAATLVADNGKAFYGQPEAIHVSQLPSLKQTAEIIKAQGAKAILQIHHGGKSAVADLLKRNDKVAPSDDQESGARALTITEIEDLIKAFGYATELAIQAGFDGVEIHGANGYLIQQFYSGHSNQRTDEWGGSREKRMRFPLAVVDAVIAARAKFNRNDFMIGYRFSPEEPEELGLTMEDTFALIDELVKKPLQYLHMSLHDFYKKARRGADTNLTRMQLVHDHIAGKLPLIGVGCLFTAEQIINAYAKGWAEFIGLGKTVMINPNIATLIKQGCENEIITHLDPEKADHYGIPQLLWEMCVKGSAWLPPVKDKNWSPLDI